MTVRTASLHTKLLACRPRPDARAGRQPRRGGQPLPRTGAAHALQHDGRLCDGIRGTGDVPQAEPELPEYLGAGALSVGRAAPGGRHIASAPFHAQVLIMDEPCAALGPEETRMVH